MHIEIEEVGLREGLQSNETVLEYEEKIVLVEKLIEAGVKRIQLGSFVNPDKVPQMSGVEDLFNYFKEHEGIVFTGLALNKKGLTRAIDAGVKHINISLSASDTHQFKNSGKSKSESKEKIKEMIETASSSGLYVKGGIQAAFGCFYEGRIPLENVMSLLAFYRNQGVNEFILSDTAGIATPGLIKDTLKNAYKIVSPEQISLHIHDTLGMGMVNIYEAVNQGVKKFDSSIAGMGGCPFMEGAAGNIATEDLVYMLSSLDMVNKDKLPDISKLIDCAVFARELFGKNFTGKVSGCGSLYEKVLVR